MYWSYARYVKASSVDSAPQGLVIKTAEFTQQLDQRKINEIVSDYNRSADTLFLDVQFYLERFVDEYDNRSGVEIEDDKELSIIKVAGPGVSYPRNYLGLHGIIKI